MAELQNLHNDFNKNVQQYWKVLYRMARAYGLSPSAANDLAQEFVKELHRKRDVLKSHPKPVAFVAKVAKCRILDFLKKMTSRLHREDSLTEWDGLESDQDDTSGSTTLRRVPEPLTSPGPEASFLEQEERKQMRQQLLAVGAAVRGFSKRRQYIFVHCLVRERHQRDVANELGMSYGAVRNAVGDIRRELRKAAQAKNP